MRELPREKWYPDTHPDIRDNSVKVTLPGGNVHEYMPRQQWESAVHDRDDYRRTIALISAWRISSGTRDPQLDRLLERAGETYESARAMAGLIDWALHASAETQPGS